MPPRGRLMPILLRAGIGAVLKGNVTVDLSPIIEVIASVSCPMQSGEVEKKESG